ncbi:MAG: helix-turn-helix domain-containing protein [Myxococcota bacterium]
MLDDPSANLARNVRQLREARHLTQVQLARLAGVPRPTLAHLETGGANPTLAVLTRVSAALSVSLEELLGPPRATGRHYPAASLPVRRRGDATVRRLLPEAHPHFDIERMELPAGARMSGVPHTPGTREYLTCEAGRVELAVAGERWVLAPGDVVVFRGDQPHSYRNAGDGAAVAYSVIAVGPSPQSAG